jgi:membrane-bound lytic murein transglycosylase B
VETTKGTAVKEKATTFIAGVALGVSMFLSANYFWPSENIHMPMPEAGLIAPQPAEIPVEICTLKPEKPIFREETAETDQGEEAKPEAEAVVPQPAVIPVEVETRVSDPIPEKESGTISEDEAQQFVAELKSECEMVRQTFEQHQQELEKAGIRPPEPEVLNIFLAVEAVSGVEWQFTYAIYCLESEAGQEKNKYRPSEVMPAKQLAAFKTICRQCRKDPNRQRVSKTGDVGPLQFQPATWLEFGIDADGDGIANPWSLTDAAASAANYLVEEGFDLSPPRAIQAYNGGKTRSSKSWGYSKNIIRLARLLGAPSTTTSS